MNEQGFPWIVEGIPLVVERYIFAQLLGSERSGWRDDDEDPEDPLSPIVDFCPPINGLYEQRSEALREATYATERINELYFDCPHCGDGPHCHPEDRDYLDMLQHEKLRHSSAANEIKHEIELLHRLANPELMGEAYALLEFELSTDQQWVRFIESARNSRMNYSEFRKIQKRTEKLLTEVAKVSRHLAKLLRDLRNTGIPLPRELRANSDDRYFFKAVSSELDYVRLRRLLEGISEPDAAPDVDLMARLFKVSEIAESLPVEFAIPEIDQGCSTLTT